MVVKGVQRGAALVGLPSAVEMTADGKNLTRIARAASRWRHCQAGAI